VSTQTAALAEDLIPAVPRSQPAPRRPRKRRQPLPRSVTALVAVTAAAAVVVLSGAVLVLHRDVVQLQREIPAQSLSCAQLHAVRLHIQNRTVRCSTRKA
jgi:uncharacterized protein (DUF58 family)